MTLFKSTDGLVCGQPMSPFFGAQNGLQGAGAVVIQSPAASPTSGPQTPAIASVANGSLPANAYITTVNGINVGPLDNCTVAELLSNGNGVTSMRGTAPPPAGGVNDQVFAGNESAVAMQQNGPTPINTEAQPLGPVSAAVLTSNLAPAGGFGG